MGGASAPDEGVGVDLGPEPWALRGARRDELWREAMAHFGAAGVFATAHVTPEGMITFEPGRVSRPPAVR